MMVSTCIEAALCQMDRESTHSCDRCPSEGDLLPMSPTALPVPRVDSNPATQSCMPATTPTCRPAARQLGRRSTWKNMVGKGRAKVENGNSRQRRNRKSRLRLLLQTSALWSVSKPCSQHSYRSWMMHRKR